MSGSAARPRRPGAREAILDAIRTAEPLSRVELAAMTGLTEASVSTTVRRLLDEGLVVETGRTPTGGKPRTLLRLDPGARVAVGVHLDEAAITYVLTGQTGGVVSRMTRPATPADAEALLARLVSDIDGLVAGSGVDRARCLGIGLVWPGPHTVDSGAALLPRRGVIGPTQNRAGVAAALLPAIQKDLVEKLEAATGWPVLIENDATAAAVGEHWVARAETARSFVALYMGSGLGAGIILDGEALRGRQASAGEFGHLCLHLDGPPCWCGSRGCLEALAGPQTVVEAALASPAALAEAALDEPASTVAAFAAIARAARSGAPACRALLDDSARYVAAAAESVVNLLDVDLLVLTGPGFAAASFVYGPAISARLAPADSRTWRRSVSVTVSPAAATASATGAAALIIRRTV
jgi:predicted NBD/HSP70 family sugar kinase